MVLFENAFQSGRIKNTGFAFQCGEKTIRRRSLSKTTTSRTERELLMRFLGESLVFKFLRPSVEGYMYVSYTPFLENDSRTNHQERV